jgi:hypothetical protein
LRQLIETCLSRGAVLRGPVPAPKAPDISARSSAGSEHQTTNLGVRGSNPFGRAIFFQASLRSSLFCLGLHRPNHGLKKVPILFLTSYEITPTLGFELGEQSPSLIDIVNMCSPDGAEIIRKKRRTPGAPACPRPMDAWGVAGCRGCPQRSYQPRVSHRDCLWLCPKAGFPYPWCQLG